MEYIRGIYLYISSIHRYEHTTRVVYVVFKALKMKSVSGALWPSGQST